MPSRNSLVLYDNASNRDGEMTHHLIEQYYESVLNNRSKQKKEVTPKDGGEQNEEDESLSSDNETTQDMDYDAGDEIGPTTFWSKMKSLCYNIFVGDYQKDLLIAKLQSQRSHAMSYAEWRHSALRLDALTSKYKWKQKLECGLYDYQLIRNLLSQLRDARSKQDYHQLLYLIRTNWVRNLGNMGNVNLYRHSYTGTKQLIDEYIEESRKCIEELVNGSDLDDGYLMGILQQTRRNIGRTALVLSGGGTFGLFHIGVLSTLFELDLLPKVISGSSAGAIVASILSVHHKEEIPALLQQILGTEFNIFKDDKKKSESENFLIKMSRFFKNGTWFNNEHLVNTMISFLGDLTFREAYNRTGKILNITVSPASLFEQPRLLNNLTAPNVLIWSAVCASCSLPGIFPSSPLYEKDLKTGETRIWNGSSSVKFVDGSVDNDLPISRLSEMFNVDHIIACQVNIHVVPFLKLSVSCVGGEIEDEFSARLRQNLGKMYNFLSNEMIHAFEVGSEMGIATNTLTKLRSVLSQQYSGDITILPDMGMLLRFNELLSNPTRDFLLREITNGARATWPKISVIENHCAQEFALDKAISFLKGRMIVSSSIRNPLQFSEFPLIKAKKHEINDDEVVEVDEDSSSIPFNKFDIEHPPQLETIQGSENNITNVLDDNLLETESPNELLLLNENATNKTSVVTDPITGKIEIQTTPASTSASTSNIYNRRIRRKSDSGMVTGSGSYFHDNHRPFRFSLNSPSAGNIHGYSNVPGARGTSHLYTKSSTGHIYFPMERRSWNHSGSIHDSKPFYLSSPSPQHEMVPLRSPRPKYKFHPHYNNKSPRIKSPYTVTRPKSNTTGQVLFSGITQNNNNELQDGNRESPSSSSSTSVNPFFPGMLDRDSPRKPRTEYRRNSADMHVKAYSNTRYYNTRTMGTRSVSGGSIPRTPVGTVEKELDVERTDHDPSPLTHEISGECQETTAETPENSTDTSNASSTASQDAIPPLSS
ncbi:Lipase 4 [Monosporozyma unispora]|nr:Lipase 4 [Kazachstania unispora]